LRAFILSSSPIFIDWEVVFRFRDEDMRLVRVKPETCDGMGVIETRQKKTIYHQIIGTK
jgi:hypothetical protein